MAVKILVGDCRQRLKEIASESISLAITSPPYWGLRAYGVEPTVWGGAGDCRHVWTGKRTPQPNASGAPSNKQDSNRGSRQADYHDRATYSEFCQHCNAWRGTLGNEPQIGMYVANLVGIFQQVQRVLHPAGALVLNLGDSYASSTTSPRPHGKGAGITGDKAKSDIPRAPVSPGLKQKDMCGIPWRVALALQADGWWLRSDIIWLKKNVMPGSQRDRPTTAHEHIFLLAKSQSYYWDGESIRQKFTDARMGASGAKSLPYSLGSGRRDTLGNATKKGLGVSPATSGRTYRTSDPWFASLDARIAQQREYLAHLEHVRANGGLLLDEAGDPLALQVNTKGFKEAHFATFPPALVAPFVKAGSSKRGVCGECKTAWVRVINSKPTEAKRENWAGKSEQISRGGRSRPGGFYDGESTILGWRPTCPHYPRTDEWRKVPRQGKDEPDADYETRIAPIVALRAELLALWEPMEAEAATVLDPFAGAGTVGLVADREQRDAILCELSADYATMAQDRIAGDAGPVFADVRIK